MNNYLESYKKEVLEIAASFDFNQRLESARITLNNELKPPPPVIQIDNNTMHHVTICTEGNISVIKGIAKSRKSFAVAMLTAAALSDKPIYRKFISIPKKLVVYFDTEQSSFYVQQAIYRIHEMTKGNGFNRFFSFCLRPYTPAERLELIEFVFENFKGLGFVVIDGIRDLIRDINSPEESTMISSKLLKWSEKSGAHILTVLHENISDGKLRGHIGTELMNKAESVLRVEKEKNDLGISTISCDMVRGLEFEPIQFRIIDNIPQVITTQSAIENFLE